MYLFSLRGLKPNDPTCMVSRSLLRVSNQCAVVPCIRKGKWLVHVNHKEVLEILKRASTVAGCIANDLIFSGDNAYLRATVKRIDHDKRTVAAGKSKSKLCGSFCRGY